jgi:hypothetical protein
MSIINRGTGKTLTERHLAKLADKSFLNLWSYANVFNDKRPAPKAQGQELCDLLVVCDPYVLVFSDKHVEWLGDEKLSLNWTRWYKRAISHSMRQIRGAQRWIETYPNRIFIDPDCRQRLPVDIPPADRRIVHGIVVAGGIRDASRRFFDGGIGSLALLADLRGEEAILKGETQPLTIGDVDPLGSFVHVFDEVSLDVVLNELDTVTDLAEYLDKKAAMFRAGQFAAADGEEDLVAYYMTHLNAKEEHDFCRPDGKSWKAGERFGIEPGTYSKLRANPQYIAKKKADRVSYIWDKLIEEFTDHMLDGTTVELADGTASLRELEIGVRQMALVPRFKRRYFGAGIVEMPERSNGLPRHCRAFLPEPKTRERATGFCVMTLKPPDPLPQGGYEQYRDVRKVMLQTYVLHFLRENPNLLGMVGIGLEPLGTGGGSEDLMYGEQFDWTAEEIQTLEKNKEEFDIARPHRIKWSRPKGNEWPDVPKRKQVASVKPYTMNRKERRAAKARARKK